jgi:DNA-binding MurR/RpiR family transcriptional regulator
MTQDARADALADDEPDSRWMTIAELAESRQISKASASRLVRRTRWRRMRDNRGAVRVYVPVGQELPQERAADARADIPADSTLQVQAIVSAKDETIANLREHVADLRTALGKAESRADELQTELDRWRMARHWWQRRRLRRAVRGT